MLQTARHLELGRRSYKLRRLMKFNPLIVQNCSDRAIGEPKTRPQTAKALNGEAYTAKTTLGRTVCNKRRSIWGPNDEATSFAVWIDSSPERRTL